MKAEEKIKDALTNKFPELCQSLLVVRPRRLSLEVNYKDFLPVFKFSAKELGFSHLCTITGLDEAENLAFIYHLAQEEGVVFNLKTSVPKSNPVLQTVTEIFPGAEIYERELVDLLGAKVEGLKLANRYPLTDDWPQGEFPLRKDWVPPEVKENA